MVKTFYSLVNESKEDFVFEIVGVLLQQNPRFKIPTAIIFYSYGDSYKEMLKNTRVMTINVRTEEFLSNTPLAYSSARIILEVVSLVRKGIKKHEQ